MGTVLTQFTVDGVALWVVLLICGGVFLGSFMDAIAGGGGIITVPTYLMGLSDFPIYNALGTNKLSSGIGTVFSTVRFIRQGYVDWALFAPAIVLALGGSVCGTWLQHHTPAVVLKYLLLLVLPVRGDALALEHDVRELRRIQGGLPGAKIVIADCGLTEEARGLANYLADREENAAVTDGGTLRVE